jgi:hypothetical protein
MLSDPFGDRRTACAFHPRTQTRIVSVATIWLVARESARPFKGIIFPDVFEFDSDMPSHAVGLCRRGPCLPTSIHPAAEGQLHYVVGSRDISLCFALASLVQSAVRISRLWPLHGLLLGTGKD